MQSSILNVKRSCSEWHSCKWEKEEHFIIHQRHLGVASTTIEVWISALTDNQVRHGKIPTSVLQGPFLASIAKFIGWGCRDSIAAYFRCNLQQNDMRNDGLSGDRGVASRGYRSAAFYTDIFVRGLTGVFRRKCGSTKDRKDYNFNHIWMLTTNTTGGFKTWMSVHAQRPT